jgi:transcriptional repressor NrdR
VVGNIEKAIMDISDKEVPTETIGKLVMMYLRHLDPIAYIRFAAVYYREFKDVDQFLSKLQDEEKHFKIHPSKEVPIEYQA